MDVVNIYETVALAVALAYAFDIACDGKINLPHVWLKVNYGPFLAKLKRLIGRIEAVIR